MGVLALTMRRAVFLDRDGVLNRAVVRNGRPFSLSGPSEVELLAGSLEACRSLRAAGFVLIVVTNQPDVARGMLRHEDVDAIHCVLRAQVPVDDIRVCYHDDADRCSCRKPQPGLLIEAARKWQIDLARSFMVGDRWKDVEAGRQAGCSTVLIDYAYAEPQHSMPDFRVQSLAEAVDWIVSRDRSSQGGHI